MSETITECPNCGFDEYYLVCRMSGTGASHYRYDGGEAENSQMHDCLKYTDGKIAYCSNCQKKLGHINKIKPVGDNTP